MKSTIFAYRTLAQHMGCLKLHHWATGLFEDGYTCQDRLRSQFYHSRFYHHRSLLHQGRNETKRSRGTCGHRIAESDWPVPHRWLRSLLPPHTKRTSFGTQHRHMRCALLRSTGGQPVVRNRLAHTLVLRNLVLLPDNRHQHDLSLVAECTTALVDKYVPHQEPCSMSN